MVVQVALWYELWTSLMDLCWIIFLFSDLITDQACILLHTDKIEEAPNKRNALANLMDMSLLRSSAASLPAPYSAANVSFVLGNASSRTTIS